EPTGRVGTSTGSVPRGAPASPGSASPPSGSAPASIGLAPAACSRPTGLGPDGRRAGAAPAVGSAMLSSGPSPSDGLPVGAAGISWVELPSPADLSITSSPALLSKPGLSSNPGSSPCGFRLQPQRATVTKVTQRRPVRRSDISLHPTPRPRETLEATADRRQFPGHRGF